MLDSLLIRQNNVTWSWTNCVRFRVETARRVPRNLSTSPTPLSAFEGLWHTPGLWEVKCSPLDSKKSHLSSDSQKSSFPSTSHSVMYERMPKMLGKMLWSLWNGHTLGTNWKNTFGMKFLKLCGEFCPCKCARFKSVPLIPLITEEMHWCALIHGTYLTGGLPEIVCNFCGNQWFLLKSLVCHTDNSFYNLCCSNAQRVVIWLGTLCARHCLDTV